MTDVYIVRHAEAEGNLFRRAHGQFNGQLTELGKKQLSFLARRLESVPLTAVYASDLRRAVQTGEAICAGRGLRVTIEPQVREMNLGIWEDLPWGELQHSYREQYVNFNKYPDRFRMEGAETFGETKQRVLSAVLRLAARHPGEKIAVCSHGGAINALLTAVREMNGEDFDRGFSDNTAISLLQIEQDRVHVAYANDSSHLPPDYTNFARQNWWQSLDSTDSGDMRYVSPELSGHWLELYNAWTPDMFALTRRAAAADQAQAMNSKHPGSLSFAVSGDAPAGLVLADADPGSPDAGEILCCFLRPELRGRYLSPQLIGQAVSVLRRSRIYTAKILLPPAAETCLAPYFMKYGFGACGAANGCAVYAKDISI